MYPTLILSTFVTLLNGQSVPCDHPLAIAEGKSCRNIQVLTELTPEHNVGDDVDGRIGYKWFHDGTSWVVIDCYYAVYSGPLEHKSVCGLTPNVSDIDRSPANGYPVWEVGATYARAYPDQKYMLLGIIISPLSGKKVLTLQKLSEPFNFISFQEDQQKEPFIKVQ
jgi:hypothetical protein